MPRHPRSRRWPRRRCSLPRSRWQPPTTRSPPCPASRSGTSRCAERPTGCTVDPGRAPARRPASTCAAPRRARARPTCSIPSTPSSASTRSCSPAAARSASTPRPASCAGSKSTASASTYGRRARADRAGRDPVRPRRRRRRGSGRPPTAAIARPRAASDGAGRRRQRRRRRRRDGRQVRAAWQRAMKGGIGSAAIVAAERPGRRGARRRSTRSATSSIRRPAQVVAGVRTEDGERSPTRDGSCARRRRVRAAPAENTTLGVVATNARLTKTQATKLAQMAHDGFARAIWPVHTPADGDTVFALATGTRGPTRTTCCCVGALAADVDGRGDRPRRPRRHRWPGFLRREISDADRRRPIAQPR